MSAPVVVGLGEVLFDIFGNAEELGGAPANFAYHAGRLGADAYIVSAIGDDERGRTALRELKNRNLNTECITVTEGVGTGYVQAEIDADGIATYLFPDNIAWDNMALNEQALHIAGTVDGVCFGTLAQRSDLSRKTIYEFLELAPAGCVKVYDINLRQNFYSKKIILRSLEHADILKLNDDELPVVSGIFDVSGSPVDILGSLAKSFSLELAVLTRGASGSLLVSPEGHSDHPGVDIENLQDTIGAGDAFTAAALISFLAGDDLDDINEKANTVAALVCSHKGAMPLF